MDKKFKSPSEYIYENEYEILRKSPDKDGMVPIRIRNKTTGRIMIKGQYINVDLAKRFERESPIRKDQK